MAKTLRELLNKYIPKVYGRIKAQGIDDLEDIFKEG